MIENEANASVNPESLTAPARKGIPLAAFHRAAAASNRTGVPLAAAFRRAAEAAPARDVPLATVSPRTAVVVRRHQRAISRSVAVRTRQRLIDRRFTRRDREASQRARRPRNGAPTASDALRDALAAPISRIIESAVAPIQRMMRQITEMIRPSWLRALQQMQERFQNLVRIPMLNALRRIQEQIAAFTRPARSFFQHIRDAVAGTTSPLMRAFQQARDWASGFMTYGAKLRRLTDAMFSSWSWKLPDINAIFRPITSNIVTLFGNIEWPDWSSLTRTFTQLAIRAVFWAAVRVRRAILHEENSEEIVREFMLEVLDLFPNGEPHVEAAKEALLEDNWLRAEPQELKKVLRRRIRELHRNHRLIGTTELGHHHIVSLETPSDRSFSDIGKILTLGEALAHPVTVEDLVLGSPEYRDHRIDRVLGRLKVDEARVANLYARHDGMTWDQAAAEAGQSPEFGERVRRKLHRLGKEFVRRQAGGLRTPRRMGSRTRPAFC